MQHYTEIALHMHCTAQCWHWSFLHTARDCLRIRKLVHPPQAMSWATNAKILPQNTRPQGHYYCTAEAKVTPALQAPNAQTQECGPYCGYIDVATVMEALCQPIRILVRAIL